ncbi:hypothetical protein DXK91_02390 [Parageobacillus toebii]|nr:hypothetical protein CN643_16225 [Parageobacillus yumthangensis]PUF90153.1 hypothetical protein DCC82_14970 [Geobacillus sp. LYN3]RDV23426.1 hypothetical protein DXK91_02390 [Parageobacillus toebii]
MAIYFSRMASLNVKFFDLVLIGFDHILESLIGMRKSVLTQRLPIQLFQCILYQFKIIFFR